MNSIEKICKELKSGRKHQVKYLDKPVAYWSEPDRFQESIINAFVIILKTKGCSWARKSGCTMCGYFNDSAFNDVSEDQLSNQFFTAMKSYKGEPVVKIFTSGSFLDPDEIHPTVRDLIISELSTKVKKIAIESRPEYIKKEYLNDLKNPLKKAQFEIGVGLETVNDTIRENFINKGFTFQDFISAVHTLKLYNHLIKTYVLLKPPFLSEQQAIQETLKTISAIKDMTDTISLNPTNVQKHTLVDFLWKKQYYRPPWLWSIVKILEQASRITSKRIQCDIVGGGSIRGAHNCDNCNREVLHAIHNFSLSQDIKDLNTKACSCKQLWEDQLVLEPLSFNSIPDIQRGLIS